MKDNLVYIHHIMDAIRQIEEYILNLDYEDFLKDQKTIDAVVRQIEIIGEASNKCSGEFQNKYSDIPWREMSDTRNKMIHDYMGVMKDFVWSVCKDDLPQLKEKLENYFDL